MKTYFSLLTVLVLIITTQASEPHFTEEIKVIEKSFQVDSNAQFSINNKYGNVTMTTWDKNLIEIRVEIKVDGRDSKAVKKRFDGISVAFNGTASSVTATTHVADVKGINKTNISIHYTVRLPKTNNINIENRYGNLFLDETKGNLNIDLKYGNLTFGKLHNPINYLRLAYVTNAKIDYVKAAQIDAAYSKLDLTRAEVLRLNVDYTDVNLGHINDLINQMDYGNLNISKVDKVSSVADYTNIKLGTLTHSLVASGDYGTLSIKRIQQGFEKLIIDSDYASLNVGIEAAAGYSVTANMKYGKLIYPSNVQMAKKIEKSTSSYYEGKTSNASGSIAINMSYGSAKINFVQ
ncbi:MAG: hypothetical protein WCY25_04150 [Moheibacter sp.]